MNIPAALNCDGYKTSHYKQYSPKTQKVYSTWTPRKSRVNGVDKVVFFGLQYFIKDYLMQSFNETFFNRPKQEVMQEISRVMSHYTGDSNTKHWEALHDLGYLPLKICAVPEGTLIPIRCPMFTIENTKPEFYWLTNFVETVMSTEIWKPMTSATIALQYKKILSKWSEKTCDNNDHLAFQGHDFSYRGMAGCDGGLSSAAGHLLSFKGTDTIPAILWLEKYYNACCEKEIVGASIPATEHAVAETNIIEITQTLLENNTNMDPMEARKTAELEYLKRLLKVYPSGLFSYVADTYNLWEVCIDILPKAKDLIMQRDGKVVIRPDSGDPVDILCGINTKTFFDDYRGIDKPCGLRTSEDSPYFEQQNKGVVELLWDLFGGKINSKGYKELDCHIGVIYGDAITMDRADEICKRLESKGFASSNVVLGIGSYTYNMNTRDTFGFALKATYGVVDGQELMLYKDPITDDGTKKSQKGKVCVFRDKTENKIMYKDNLCEKDKQDLLAQELHKDNQYKQQYEMLLPVFENGKLLKDWSLKQIRDTLEQETKG